MARQLTKEIVDTIMNNAGLYGDVSEALGVKLISLPKVIQRTPDRLSHYDVVTKICEVLNKNPNDILEEVHAFAEEEI